MEISHWLTKQVHKTNMHCIIEKEAKSSKEKEEKARSIREMQKAQMQAYGKVVRENFKPRVSEALRGELLQREAKTREREERIREIKEQKGYRDYLID
jgi:hypothetical protein